MTHKQNIQISLGWPKFSGNNRNLRGRNGRQYANPAYTAYKQQSFYTTRNTVKQTITADVSVSITLYMPDRRKRDIDNYLKIIFDTLMYCNIIKDDSQIIELYAKKIVCKDDPRIIIDIVKIL